jgi:hypothetical protein
MSRLVVVASVLFMSVVSAQPSSEPLLEPAQVTVVAPRLPPSSPSVPPLMPVVPAIRPPLPADRPDRLIAAQQLALTAYPELRQLAAQIRVTEGVDGPTVTFAAAERDRADILALSRPRAALLVVETTFDTQQQLSRALLRGTLAHSAERRRIAALADGWTQALQAEGAQFDPARQAAFAQRLTGADVGRLMGALSIQAVQFQRGSGDEPLYWQVAATTPNGEAMTLAFEPYAGRLVRIVKGGAQ